MAIPGIPYPGVSAYVLGSERRHHPRRAMLHDRVVLDFGDATGVIVDLGEGGMRVRAQQPLTLRPDGLVVFQLPNERRSIAVHCALAWSDSTAECGLRFVAFSGSGRASLQGWLNGEEEPDSKEEIVASEPAPSAVLPTALSQEHLAEAAEPSVQAEDEFLRELVLKMMIATAADGAAIALRRGPRIVCCATAGNAPNLGAELNPEAGLSGACLRSCEPVLCRDTETDPTVNAAACGAMQVRAALLVPIKQNNRVGGVLEVFSSKPDLFDAGDVIALLRVADSMAHLLDEAPPAERPVIDEVEHDHPTPATAFARSATAAPNTRTAARGAVVCGSCGHTNLHPGRDCERCYVPLPIRTESPERGIRKSRLSELALSRAVLQFVDDPHHETWKRAAHWSAKLIRKGISWLSLTVPLSYVGYFLLGPVVRPGALEGTSLLAYMSAVVEPGMRLADYLFSFRAVIRGWNFMFLVVAVVALLVRALVLQPFMFSLRKIEELTRPRKHYTYMPFVPHRTDFK